MNILLDEHHGTRRHKHPSSLCAITSADETVTPLSLARTEVAADNKNITFTLTNGISHPMRLRDDFNLVCEQHDSEQWQVARALGAHDYGCSDFKKMWQDVLYKKVEHVTLGGEFIAVPPSLVRLGNVWRDAAVERFQSASGCDDASLRVYLYAGYGPHPQQVKQILENGTSRYDDIRQPS